MAAAAALQPPCSRPAAALQPPCSRLAAALHFMRYPSDLSDREWSTPAPLLPPPQSGGRPRSAALRRAPDRQGHLPCAAQRRPVAPRLLPRDDDGPWSTGSDGSDGSDGYDGYDSFRAQWRREGPGREGPGERVHTTLRERRRQQLGREPTPHAAIIDRQSVKTTERGGPHGDDGAPKRSGRKRHLLVEMLGLVLRVLLHPADLQDRAGAPVCLLLPACLPAPACSCLPACLLLRPLASAFKCVQVRSSALPRRELIGAESASRARAAADLGVGHVRLAAADRCAPRRARAVVAGGPGAAAAAAAGFPPLAHPLDGGADDRLHRAQPAHEHGLGIRARHQQGVGLPEQGAAGPAQTPRPRADPAQIPPAFPYRRVA